jgi:hypothetical protein
VAHSLILFRDKSSENSGNSGKYRHGQRASMTDDNGNLWKIPVFGKMQENIGL